MYRMYVQSHETETQNESNAGGQAAPKSHSILSNLLYNRNLNTVVGHSQ